MADVMEVPFLDLRPRLVDIRETAHAALEDVLETGTLVLGPAVERFEAAFAAYCGTEYAAGVASGTDALALALAAAGVRAGDEVITPAFTCVPTAEAICSIGAVPVLVDVHPEDWTLDPEALPLALSARTRAIVPVHLYGRPADMRAITEFAQANGIVVIADAAQAHGATWAGTRGGALGDAAAFSFYPTKNLGCLGDGGMVVSDNPDLVAGVRVRREYGLRNGIAVVPGRNSRLDELQAAVLLRLLDHLESENSRRRTIALRYSAALAGAGPCMQRQVMTAGSAWHLYVLAVEDRGRFRRQLATRGVGSAVHYARAVHEHPVFANNVRRVGGLAVSTSLARRVVSLPLNPNLTEADVERVIDAASTALSL